MSKFITVSKQATELDKTRILLETRIQEVKDKCKKWVEVTAKDKDNAKELQKRNDELSTLLEKAKGDAVVDFKPSKPFTDLLDTNYVAGFEDFRMEAIENFPKVDFSSIKLNLGGTASSSLLQTSLEVVNIEDDTTTQPAQDDPSIDAPPS